MSVLAKFMPIYLVPMFENKDSIEILIMIFTFHFIIGATFTYEKS